jgi:predicted transcriptional regulator
MRTTKRSRSEIFPLILRAVNVKALTASEIQFRTYLSFQQLKECLTILIECDLIGYIAKEKRFKITLRGIHALEAYNKMDELLVEKQVSKKMESAYFE